ncbi:hypothetical protein [Synechocystis salina]|nr:hypothetical protein [Synechocystis salina]
MAIAIIVVEVDFTVLYQPTSHRNKIIESVTGRDMRPKIARKDSF